MSVLFMVVYIVLYILLGACARVEYLPAFQERMFMFSYEIRGKSWIFNVFDGPTFPGTVFPLVICICFFLSEVKSSTYLGFSIKKILGYAIELLQKSDPHVEE